jgi:hypothetical protein
MRARRGSLSGGSSGSSRLASGCVRRKREPVDFGTLGSRVDASAWTTVARGEHTRRRPEARRRRQKSVSPSADGYASSKLPIDRMADAGITRAAAVRRETL